MPLTLYCESSDCASRQKPVVTGFLDYCVIYRPVSETGNIREFDNRIIWHNVF